MVSLASSGAHAAQIDMDEAAGPASGAMRPLPRISIQAFVETAQTYEAIEEAGRDRRMAKTQVRVQNGGIKAACAHYAGASTPNLIILESALDPDALLAELEALAQHCDAGTRVLVIGRHNDVRLYRELMQRGISEYLVAPVSLVDILEPVARIFVDDEAAPLGRTLAFVGAKGGVGSSTIAHNVAWTIARLFSAEVVLADLDLPFGTANINFDQDPPQGIAEAVSSADRLDEILLDRLLVRCAEHLSLLAAPSVLDRTYDFSGDAFAALIEAAQRSTPVVVLDVPHVWNEWTRSVLRQADEIVLTAIPDLANLRNAKNFADTLKVLRPNDPAPRIVLNQVGAPKRPEIPAGEFLDAIGLEAAATIGFDPQLFGTSANNGQMIAETEPKHAANEAMRDLAHLVTGRSLVKRSQRTGAAMLLDLVRRKRA